MRNPRLLAQAVLLLSVVACDRATIVAPEPHAPAPQALGSFAGGPWTYVTNVEELYDAANDPAKAGVTIVLAAGTYVLTAQTPGGVARPNAGRLELQRDMSLLGRWGNASAVVIDMSQLPPSSFNAPPVGNTGALRVGRGANAIEWLTILGNPKSGAGVETDLVDAQPASVRVAHVVEHESVRGVDVRNVGAAMSGRRVAVRIEFSEFYHGVEAVRVANLNEALGGELEVTMAGNSFHDNAAGCLIVHNRASDGKIRVRSIGDRVEHNRLGCLVTGGLITGAGVANANTTEFEAFGSSFSNNTSTDWENTVIIDRGGLVVLAAETPGAANTASGNTVSVALWATTVRGNQNEDFQAFGARSTASPPGIAGTDNHATIALHGLSRWIDVVAVNSMPADPGGTNTVSIVR